MKTLTLKPSSKRRSKIPKDKITQSKSWKPPDKEISIQRNMHSWFNLDQMNYDTVDNNATVGASSIICSKPIVLYPTLEQRNVLVQWNEVYRRVYNLTVAYMKNNLNMNFIRLRPIIDNIVAQNAELTKLSKGCGILKHTRDNAIKDCIKAYKTAFANLGARNIKHFKLRYKKKTHHLSSIVLEPVAFAKLINGFAVKKLGPMISSEPLKGIKKECRLCYNSRTKVFILRVPYDRETLFLKKSGYVAALDPGIRTFQTIYSPQGNCYELCSNESNLKLKKIIDKIHKPNVKNTAITSKKFRKVKPKKYLDKMRDKLQNMVKDMHFKAAYFLCKSFDTILIGNMSTKSILSKDNVLRTATKRLCLAQSHYKFRTVLESTARRFGTIIKVVDESYSSKTCDTCGEIKDDLGSNKRFNCNFCNNSCDRDINAARNIYIKNIN
jgi:putative transposase